MSLHGAGEISHMTLITSSHSRWTNIHHTYLFVLIPQIISSFCGIRSDNEFGNWHGAGLENDAIYFL